MNPPPPTQAGRRTIRHQVRAMARLALLCALALGPVVGAVADAAADPLPSPSPVPGVPAPSPAPSRSVPTATPTPSPASPASAVSPTPSPGVSPAPAQPGAGSGEECGFVDIGCRARQAVNGWFQDLVVSASKPVFDLVRSTALGTPGIDSPDMARARDLWGTSQTIANTCFVLLVTLGGMWLMAGHSLPGAELTPGELLARVVAAFLASNLSLILIGHAIVFANGLATAFLAGAEKKITPAVLADTVAGNITGHLTPMHPFASLLALTVVVLAVCLGFIYIIRIAIMMVLIAVAPVALMFHALPFTDGLARLWWRGITGILAIQVVQSLVLATVYQLLFTRTGTGGGSFLGVPPRNELVDLLLGIALLWVMIRIPSWVARTVWQPAQPRMLSRLVKTLLVYRGISFLAKAGTAAMRSGTCRPPRPQPRPARAPRHAMALPPPAAPAPPDTPTPGPASTPSSTPQQGDTPVQLALPIDIPRKPAPQRPVQLALPFPVTRVPRAPTPSAPAPGARRPAVRSGQLMLPGMPKRPVPHRQLPLWIEPPKSRRTR